MKKLSSAINTIILIIVSMGFVHSMAMAQSSFSDEVMRLSLGDSLEAPVQFELGSSTLTAESLTLLNDVAAQMKSELNIRFEIEGHTDMSGGYLVNQRLSEERAKSVANYLASVGVEKNRLLPKGFSYDKLLEGLPMNDASHRRVMFKRTQ